MLKRLILLLILFPFQLSASGELTREMLSQMRFGEIVTIMREEGISDSRELPKDLMMGQVGASWEHALSSIYDIEMMTQTVESLFLGSLGSKNLEGILEFVSSAAWQTAMDLELAARHAMLAPEIEQMAYDSYYQALSKNTRLVRDLEALVDSADLVEQNVVGALNGMYQFNLGLVDGGLEMGYTEDELLAQIWTEEESIRNDVSEWMFAFLMLAYDSIERQMLLEQIRFFQTSEGRRLNAAMFDAFDGMLNDITYQLGFALAGMMQESTL